jgi:hypothetical protein
MQGKEPQPSQISSHFESWKSYYVSSFCNKVYTNWDLFIVGKVLNTTTLKRGHIFKTKIYNNNYSHFKGL